ncbi:Bifunctional inhibitor/lipid-transfer protein/seed storage 2S albumin protein [Dioscorea alata]|uniref:Bifunctional inhibitor/lipid-transfer protein/seed storage 2S albumin protein n=1 Tax=Dioscorea alata TaxID=55571 RepID=A0ACB7UGS7_DIOAL|nr:Bifunctional inhibitor/lipid-transfer protein/seed storage 2S albumin protein [Dioscorea alata]
MASKSNALAALFLIFNLMFFVSASANTPYGTCPYDSLKLKVCVDVLNGLAKVVLGQSQMQPCCDLLPGVLDANVAACLCTAIDSTLLGTIPVKLSLLVNQCGWSLPNNFHCA